MERPATRVLAVLELLQAHGRMSGPELARRIGVDGRTLRRYIAALEEIGIPVTAGRGRHGGYALMPGFKLPPMVFTDDEALALSVGLLAARGLGLAESAPAVASAQAKLERVMPANLKRRVRAIDETVALDLAHADASADSAALVVLSQAAQARQRVHLHYRTAQRGASERDFDPYGLAWRGGRWYAVGHCHLRGGVRSFRLDRIEQVHPVPASFGRPDDFDALAHLVFSMATLPRTHAIEVLLHADVATARREIFDTIGVLEPAGDGTVLFAQADDLDWFARELSRLPFGFEVRHPATLRAALRDHANRLQHLAM
ncbi:helix-turn-helix transcriptional regulator [Luteimonas sp. 22616]|jgi:predicted DNA-binding transcriptional regulator YafY|uniref:helix-turn-helix transcriptional regulator n=1 Tax=Luteimonas sp. 22616 TaxID=3453951 RepID=UPI003F830B66